MTDAAWIVISLGILAWAMRQGWRDATDADRREGKLWPRVRRGNVRGGR